MMNEKEGMVKKEDYPLAASKDYKINHLKMVAYELAKSDLFPQFKGDLNRRAANLFALFMLAQARGLHPIEAQLRFHIIDGQPTKRADAILAEFREAGGRVRWLKRTDEEVEAEFFDPKDPEAPPVKVRWTLEEAKRTGLAIGREGRLKDNWKKFPRAMLSARVISEGVRMVAPEIVVGIYTPEEIQDVVYDEKIKNVKAEVEPEKKVIVPEIEPVKTEVKSETKVEIQGPGKDWEEFLKEQDEKFEKTKKETAKKTKKKTKSKKTKEEPKEPEPPEEQSEEEEIPVKERDPKKSIHAKIFYMLTDEMGLEEDEVPKYLASVLNRDYDVDLAKLTTAQCRYVLKVLNQEKKSYKEVVEGEKPDDRSRKPGYWRKYIQNRRDLFKKQEIDELPIAAKEPKKIKVEIVRDILSKIITNAKEFNDFCIALFKGTRNHLEDMDDQELNYILEFFWRAYYDR